MENGDSSKLGIEVIEGNDNAALISENQTDKTEHYAVDEFNVETIHITEQIGVNPNELSGIAGWLIVIAIGRILSPVILLWSIFTVYLPQITSDTLNELSQPSNPAYSELWRPTVLFELVGNIIFLLISIIVLFLFFSRNRFFPKMIIGVLLFTVVFTIIDAVLLSKIQSSISIELGVNPMSQTRIPILSCIIWIPYFLTSKRVKNTFVR